MASKTVRAALVVMLVLAACRTAAPAQPAAEAAARRAPAADVVYVPFLPTMLVVRGDQPFLMLHAIVARPQEAAPSLDIAFVASLDASGARADDAPQRAARSAAFLLEAFGPLLPPDLREANVTAVFGAPGAWGLGITAHAVREGGGWDASEPGALHPVLVPPLPNQLARPAQGERDAVEAARTFLERADEGDGDGVWDLASATVKATTSRQSFEEIWRDGGKPRSTRRERFRQYDLHTGEFRIGDLLLVCFASEGGVETVHMRLDDDQEWRVADFARSSAAAGRRAPSVPITSSQSAARVSPSQDTARPAP